MRIELRSITKSFFDRREVLRDITVAEDFGALAVIGPSGSGKSTLLRILGGLILPTSGDVIIDGQEMRFDERHLIGHRRKVGYVFQAKGLFNHLTGRQNITMPLIHVHGYGKREADEVADMLLGRFGLLDDADKLPGELSGGQQQRIAIARAVSARPKLLLLDEPTSALDPELTNEVLDMIKELRNEGLNIILVTHEMGFAKKACDKIFFLYEGKLLERGSSTEFFNAPGTPESAAFLSKILEWNV